MQSVYRNNWRDNPASNEKKDNRVTVIMGQPIGEVAQNAVTQKIAQNREPNKPINPVVKQISDDDVDIVDDEHLKEVDRSADITGL